MIVSSKSRFSIRRTPIRRATGRSTSQGNRRSRSSRAGGTPTSYTPIPKAKKRKGAAEQAPLVFDEGKGLSIAEQRYDHSVVINSVRQLVEQWRLLPNPNDWRITPEPARLLQHWRGHPFNSIRPFFCQIEAVETAGWLTELAPQVGKAGEGLLAHLANASSDANPGLMGRGDESVPDLGAHSFMQSLVSLQSFCKLANFAINYALWTR